MIDFKLNDVEEGEYKDFCERHKKYQFSSTIVRIIKIIFLTIVTLLMLFFIVLGMYMVWKGFYSTFNYIYERYPDLCVYFTGIVVGLIMIFIGKITLKTLFFD